MRLRLPHQRSTPCSQRSNPRSQRGNRRSQRSNRDSSPLSSQRSNPLSQSKMQSRRQQQGRFVHMSTCMSLHTRPKRGSTWQIQRISNSTWFCFLLACNSQPIPFSGVRQDRVQPVWYHFGVSFPRIFLVINSRQPRKGSVPVNPTLVIHLLLDCVNCLAKPVVLWGTVLATSVRKRF